MGSLNPIKTPGVELHPDKADNMINFAAREQFKPPNTELSGICRKAEAWRSQTTFEANVRGRAAPGLNGLLGGGWMLLFRVPETWNLKYLFLTAQ